jgi:hypothetical protein
VKCYKREDIGSLSFFTSEQFIVSPCDILSSELGLVVLVPFLIKTIVYIEIDYILRVDVIGQFEGSSIETNKNYNIKLLGVKVNMVQH